MESVLCGQDLPLLRRYQFDIATGRHKSILAGRNRKDDQHWITVPGATFKAASPAGPALSTSSSVSGVTQQFEQLPVKTSSSAAPSTGLILVLAQLEVRRNQLRRAIAGISMEIRHLQLLLRRLPRKVGEGHPA